MPGENEYCRSRVASMFNHIPGCAWIPNINTTFASGAVSSGAYESGRPDAFVFSHGRVLAVECKAFFGSVYLGDFANPDDKRGWTYAQRRWYENVCVPTGVPYGIALWAYPDHERPRRVMQKDAHLYIVPPSAWLEMERDAGDRGRKTVALFSELEREHAMKDLFVDRYFAPYALVFADGAWKIPAEHPLHLMVHCYGN